MSIKMPHPHFSKQLRASLTHTAQVFFLVDDDYKGTSWPLSERLTKMILDNNEVSLDELKPVVVNLGDKTILATRGEFYTAKERHPYLIEAILMRGDSDALNDIYEWVDVGSWAARQPWALPIQSPKYKHPTGNQLKELRANLGLKQKDFAKICGIAVQGTDVPTARRWESSGDAESAIPYSCLRLILITTKVINVIPPWSKFFN